MMPDNEIHRLMEREFPDHSRGQRQVLAELYQELKAQGAPERWEREAAAEETERPVCTLAKKKSRKPPASVSSRPSDDLEDDMKQLAADPFWVAARPAGREIEKLADLAAAMAWLRLHQPKAHWQLTEFWPERLRDLWEAGKLREFQEALRVWVQVHVEVCAIYGSREKKIGFETNDLPVAFGSTGRG